MKKTIEECVPQDKKLTSSFFKKNKETPQEIQQAILAAFQAKPRADAEEVLLAIQSGCMVNQ